MQREPRFDMAGYAGLDLDRFVRRSLCSWERPGWRSLLLQKFEHVEAAGEMVMPPSADAHLWLITGGAGQLHIDTGEGWRTTPITPGEIGMATPGVPTRLRYETTAPMHSIHVHLPADVLDRVVDELGGPALPAGDPAPDSGELIGAVLKSLAAATAAGADELYADAAARFLVVHLAIREGRRGSADRTRREDVRVRKAIAYMRDRLSEPVRLAELAEEVRLSPYHFLRVFKQATGETPVRYLTRLRIAHATRLLENGMTVSQVARRCGFSSPGHLSSAFLRETGVRPSAVPAK
ncbi:helix-turn-helix domain-containing protein [Nonomuraea sp. CA-143628]|uniref:helix-turn-helix domain-containing protein n=1 Tax=Nonomuraea sp. CA-143628 TaxID=3239997 RepID=UPI003D8DCCC9